jgi:hypothetical protein
VLQSIYEGDENFRILQPAQFTYKICEDEDELKHFVVGISWPPEYPHKLPEVNLDIRKYKNVYTITTSRTGRS